MYVKLFLKKSIIGFLRNKRGLELGIGTLLLLVILFASGTAVMLVMMGKWLDLTGYRYRMETQRNAMNLIQLIVSNSPVVKKVTDQPDKLILDSNKLDIYETNAGRGTQIPSDERELWESCCDFLNFDHNFTVHDIETKKNWTIGNLVFSESECYPQRVHGFADVPVVVSQNGNNHPAVAVVRLMKTPLSDLSFWLSQAFMRAHWDDYWNLFPEENEYTIYVPLDPEIRKVIIEGERRICTQIDRDGIPDIDDIVVCKEFVYKDKSYPEKKVINFVKKPEAHSNDCMNAIITVKDVDPGLREVIITYPG